MAKCPIGFTVLVLCGALAALAHSTTTSTPVLPTARAEVLVLGTYHMANPGHDIFNTQADDVLAPKRQAEIVRLIEVLKRFQPTKIAVKAEIGNDRTPRLYADYLAGKHELSRNEIEQIGFRLAKVLGHTTVYPTDVDGDFPFERVVDYAKATGRSKELDALMAETRKEVEAENAYLTSHTILEALLRMNSDDQVAKAVGFYYRLAGFGERGDWAGADLIAEWVRRNMRIYTSVMRLIDSPDERVLVIFGAGHLGWLRGAFAGNPEIRLRKLAEFAN